MVDLMRRLGLTYKCNALSLFIGAYLVSRKLSFLLSLRPLSSYKQTPHNKRAAEYISPQLVTLGAHLGTPSRRPILALLFLEYACLWRVKQQDLYLRGSRIDQVDPNVDMFRRQENTLQPDATYSVS